MRGGCGSRGAPCPPTPPALVSSSCTLRGARAGVGVIGHPSHARPSSVGTPSPSLLPWSRGRALPRRRGWRRYRRRLPCVTWLLPRRYVRTSPHGCSPREGPRGGGRALGAICLSAALLACLPAPVFASLCYHTGPPWPPRLPAEWDPRGGQRVRGGGSGCQPSSHARCRVPLCAPTW